MGAAHQNGPRDANSEQRVVITLVPLPDDFPWRHTTVEVVDMFCSKCGVDLPEDSQFCRKCGQAQSVAPTSAGAAAAVAPARIRVATLPPKNNTAKWVLGLLALLFICGLVWQMSLHAFDYSHTAAQTPPLQQHKLSMPKGAFTVRQLSTSNYRFVVPAGASDVTMKGHFTATGGSGNDIEVVVISEDEFVNWQNGHLPTHPLYNSGKVTQGSINLTLPADAATYYVVFNNKFSIISPKAVEANIDVNFYTR